MTITIEEYSDLSGKNRFGEWAAGLDDRTFLRVQTSLRRLEQGNFGNTKSLGEGVHELRIPHGPGYRVYFGNVGPSVVLLLGGGTKQRQQSDIDAAKQAWKEYKCRKSASRDPSG